MSRPQQPSAEPPTTLVTGAAGFVGSWIVPELKGRGARVVGVRKPDLPAPSLGIEWVDTDLRDPQATRALIRMVRPARVVHLAAVASPREAHEDPLEALQVNYVAVDLLLRAMHEFTPAARMLYVSSGEVYGRRSADAAAPCERDRLSPAGIYAASKLAAERRIEFSLESDGLDVVRARPFNHTGPGRPPIYAESSFARQIAEIERGKREPVVSVGNLEAVRDFSDVRDIVRAYALLLERGARGEIYNVCTGTRRTLGAVLDQLRHSSQVEIQVDVDAELFEPAAPEQLALIGDPAKLNALGWSPSFTFEETVADLLDYWRALG